MIERSEHEARRRGRSEKAKAALYKAMRELDDASIPVPRDATEVLVYEHCRAAHALLAERETVLNAARRANRPRAVS